MKICTLSSVLILDEKREQDNVHDEEALRIYMSFNQKVSDVALNETAEDKQIIDDVQVGPHHFEAVQQIVRDLSRTRKVHPDVNEAFEELLRKL